VYRGKKNLKKHFFALKKKKKYQNYILGEAWKLLLLLLFIYLFFLKPKAISSNLPLLDKTYSKPNIIGAYLQKGNKSFKKKISPTNQKKYSALAIGKITQRVKMLFSSSSSIFVFATNITTHTGQNLHTPCPPPN
jgi:hypothetical protein